MLIDIGNNGSPVLILKAVSYTLSILQNELRKAALERSGGEASRKVVLPGKDEAKDPRVLDVDHLTQTQVGDPFSHNFFSLCWNGGTTYFSGIT